jgi:hypothetical protein
MTKLVVGVVVFVAVLGIVVGLYATGPKYIVYCDPGHRLTLGNSDRGLLAGYDPRLIPEGGDPFGPAVPPRNRQYCQSKYGSEWRNTKLRRLGAWERVWYALVGSKNTRG